MASNTLMSFPNQFLTQGNEVYRLSGHMYQMVDTYLYLYHLNQYFVLPSYADSVSDTTSVSFASSTPLTRSAPIYSYQNSGPRTIQANFTLHRDMMKQINYGNNSLPAELNGFPENDTNDDHVDLFIKAVQAAALPRYDMGTKMVNPPIVALRLGDEIFIKGVIVGGVGVTYRYPILSNGKYSHVEVSFHIAEVTPFDAETVMQTGSYRFIRPNLDNTAYTFTDSSTSSNSFYQPIATIQNSRYEISSNGTPYIPNKPNPSAGRV